MTVKKRMLFLRKEASEKTLRSAYGHYHITMSHCGFYDLMINIHFGLRPCHRRYVLCVFVICLLTWSWATNGFV